jgi:superfamily II DNA/RNA helicase
LKTKVAGGTIVFSNTREQCDKIAQEMTDKGYSCLLYRGEMEKNQRRENLKKFRSGEVDVLISTDLAARGLDLEHVGRVVNYHLPKQMDNYLHRVGRTARAGRAGLVINSVTERDLELIAAIEGKGQAPKELKTRFQGKDGKRLHVAEELRKQPRKKSKPASENAGRKKMSSRPKFKPKPKPPGLVAWEAEQKAKSSPAKPAPCGGCRTATKSLHGGSKGGGQCACAEIRTVLSGSAILCLAPRHSAHYCLGHLETIWKLPSPSVFWSHWRESPGLLPQSSVGAPLPVSLLPGRTSMLQVPTEPS